MTLLFIDCLSRMGFSCLEFGLTQTSIFLSNYRIGLKLSFYKVNNLKLYFFRKNPIKKYCFMSNQKEKKKIRKVTFSSDVFIKSQV